jgi:lipoyl-dependent peroxiredoxin
MKTTKAGAIWTGDFKRGNGIFRLPSVSQEIKYTASARFGDERGANPEELIAAAHAGCFSMALSLALSQQGYEVKSISTTSEVTIEESGGGFRISRSKLVTNAEVAGIKESEFLEIAEKAKSNCPVSKALSSLEIILEAHLSGQ